MIGIIILLALLTYLSWQDYREQQIYCIIPVIGCIIGLICNYLNDSFYNAVFGLIFGFLVLYVFYFLVLKFKKKEGLGFGDVLVSAMIGAFLGFNDVYFALVFGFSIALVFGFIKKQKKIPLVPFFSLGVLFTQLLGVFYEIKVFDFAL